MNRPGLVSTLTASFLERLASSITTTLLAVYLTEAGWATSVATMTAGAVLGASYLVSVLAAPHAGARWALSISMMLLASSFASLLGGATLIAVGLLPIASGLYRPAIMLQLDSRRGSLGTEQVMARYLFLLNLAYLLGPVTADTLRLRVGWAGVFVLCLVACVASLALSLATAQLVETPPTRSSAGPSPRLAVVLAAVIVCYGLHQQTIGPLALICEVESTPMMLLRHAQRLHAGGLAGLHGALVLGGMGLRMVWRWPARWPLFTGMGLVISALAFAVLAFATYPLPQNCLVLALMLLSIGETLTGPGLLALGAKLAGFRRSLYWLAAALGYLGGGALSVLWGCLSHRTYLLTIGGVCLVSATLLTWLSPRHGSELHS
jgi:hypothetical protein